MQHCTRGSKVPLGRMAGNRQPRLHSTVCTRSPRAAAPTELLNGLANTHPDQSLAGAQPKVLSVQAAVFPDDTAPDDDQVVGGRVGVPLRGGGRQLQRPALADVADRRLLLFPCRLRHLACRQIWRLCWITKTPLPMVGEPLAQQ